MCLIAITFILLLSISDECQMARIWEVGLGLEHQWGWEWDSKLFKVKHVRVMIMLMRGGMIDATPFATGPYNAIVPFAPILSAPLSNVLRFKDVAREVDNPNCHYAINKSLLRLVHRSHWYHERYHFAIYPLIVIPIVGFYIIHSFTIFIKPKLLIQILDILYRKFPPYIRVHFYFIHSISIQTISIKKTSYNVESNMYAKDL